MAVRDPETGRFANVENRRDMLQEQTGAQSEGPPNPNAFSLGSMLWGNAGTPENPLAFPGYQYLYTGSYDTYRWMLQHPILRLVRSIAVSPIGASTWEYEKSISSVPDDYVEIVKSTFDPIRMDLLNDFFSPGRDMGWAGGEPIWFEQNGQMKIERVKPLLQDVTDILIDDHGNFVGLRNYMPVRGQPPTDLPAPFKAWKYTYDGMNGNHYGRSWLENVRVTAWRDWLDCAQQLQKLGAKITGIVAIVISPAGSFPTGDPNKPTITYRENAEKVIKALANGAAGAWFPSLALAVDAKGNVDAMRLLADLAGKSLTSIQLPDFGSNSPAILGILSRMRHDEELMFAGGLRPSRVGLEGEHGTKAEAGVHTDTGTVNSELDDTDFARKLQPLVDAVLVANKGQKAKGTVRINPASLVERMAATIKAFLLAGVNFLPEFGTELFRTMDIDKSLKALSIATTKPFDSSKVVVPEKTTPSSTPSKTPEPQGGRPKQE